MKLTRGGSDRLQLTRRGRGAAALAVLAIVFGWGFGARSLNAIAAPTLVALVAGAFFVSRGTHPSVELSELDPGFPGETRTISLALSGTGLTTVELSFPDGVEGMPVDCTATVPDTIERELELDSRGVYRIGPPKVEQRDPLGLFERPVDVDRTTELLVYPRLYSLSRGAILSQFFLDELEAERQEFERLREYTPGDPLRRIHWKSSAKHDEYLVMEFSPSRRSETATIVGTAPRGEVDRMARIAATIADLALDSGFNVEVAVPGGHVPPGQGTAHRENILRLLARTKSGMSTPLDGEDADFEITFESGDLVVRLVDRWYTASELLANARVDETSTRNEFGRSGRDEERNADTRVTGDDDQATGDLDRGVSI